MNHPTLIPIRAVGNQKSISDDDLCSGCEKCQFKPGEMSGCSAGFPGLEDSDGYVVECESFSEGA